MKCSMNGSNGGNGLSLSWCNISCFLKTASLVVIAWSLYDIAHSGPRNDGWRGERVAERGDAARGGGGPRQ